jgi:hypothetical protein
MKALTAFFLTPVMGWLASAATPSFVQGTAYLDSTFQATAVSAAFASTPKPGNAIIVGCMGDGGSKTFRPDGVTDNQGNIYTQVVFQNYVGSGQPTALYIATNIVSDGDFIVTCAGIDQPDAINLFAAEYSGLAADDPVDGVNPGGAQSGDYPRTCGSVTTSGPYGLIVALFNNDGRDSPAGIQPGEGYTLLDCAGGTDGKCAAQDGSRYQLGALASAVTESAGTYAPGFTAGPAGSGSQSICVVAAFKAALY